MSKKFNKIMSVVLALMMVCSLLPMSAMAAEDDPYTVTFAPGNLCLYTGEGAYPTRTYDGTGEFTLPEPATLNLVGRFENFEFQGWTLEGGDGTLYNAGDNVADLITGDVTFLANYMEPVVPGTVTYTIDPGTIANETTNLPRTNGPIPEQYVTEISLPADDNNIASEFGWVIPANTTFAHWVKQDGTVIDVVTDPETGSRTVSFLPANGDKYTAVWESTTVTTYTVTLHPGTAGGTAVPGEPVEDGSFAAGTEYYGPAENPFTVIGYHSAGWSYTDGGEAIEFPITVNGDIDLYALWEENVTRDYWKVTLHAGEGASFQTFVSGFENEDGNLIAQAEKEREYNIALPSAFDTAIVEEEDENGNIVQVEVNATFATQPEGMEFAGWRNDSTGEVHYSGEVITVSADSAFTAQWRPENSGPYYLIYNAGVMADFTYEEKEYINRPFDVTVPVGESRTLPANKEEIAQQLHWNIPDDVEFIGWVNATDMDTPITEVSGMRNDVTVVALWETPELNVFTVTFDANGGTGEMEPQVFTSYDTTYTFTVPDCDFIAPEGETFDYWTDADDNFYSPDDTIDLTGDITLIAMWTEARSSNFMEG